MTDTDSGSLEVGSFRNWLVLAGALLVAAAIWIGWVVCGIGLVHKHIAEKVVAAQPQSGTSEGATPPAASAATPTAEEKRAAKFAEVGQAGDAFGSLNTAFTALAGALVFWAGYMQHLALKHARGEAQAERIARQKQASDSLKTMEIAERSARLAEDANQLARDSYFASQRAWIKVDMAPGGPLHYNVNGLNLTFNVKLTNVGNSPALCVFPNLRVQAPAVGVDSNFDERALLDELASQLKGRPLDSFGSTLFPGESLTQQIGVSMSQADVDRVTTVLKAIYPRILCVVTYGTVYGGAEVRLTTSLYELRRIDTSRPEAIAANRSQIAIFVDDGDIPQHELHLLRSLITPGRAE